MAYYATPYTIHFDDTMAYGSHHFLTSFKFQCAAREAFLFGERIFDIPGVSEDLDRVHLLTSDAYSRNLLPTKLGDRVVILLSLEEWGRVSARFCYRILNPQGQGVGVGFQTLICADPSSGSPMPIPPRLRAAMDAMRAIEERRWETSFRDRVLAGGSQLEALFSREETQTAIAYLAKRYPAPGVISDDQNASNLVSPEDPPTSPLAPEPPHSALAKRGLTSPAAVNSRQPSATQAWVFAGQGAFDAAFLIERVHSYRQQTASARETLEQVVTIAAEELGGDVRALVGDSVQECQEAVRATPQLAQVALHLQNVLGAELEKLAGHSPAVLLGHSFGELAAFGAAGCFDLPTGVRIVCQRSRAVLEHAPPNGGLLVALAARHEVASEVQFSGLNRVVIAGRNHDRQTVLSGPGDQLEAIARLLQARGTRCVRVNSPTAFHHPELRAAAADWLAKMRMLPFQTPTKTIYSPIGRRFLRPDEDFALVLASQLLRPFDFQGGIADLHASGIDHFIDCGSSGSLGQLISQAGPSSLKITRPGETARDDVRAGRPGAGGRGTDRHAVDRGEVTAAPAAGESPGDETVQRIAVVGHGCILPGGVSSPETLLTAIQQRRSGLVDQRDVDPHWSGDFYSQTLTADRSTSHLAGRVQDAQIVAPPGIAPEVFEQFTRTQKLLCIALAPCVESLRGASRIACLIGATADGFEDQDKVSSLILAGIDPAAPPIRQRIEANVMAAETPHAAVQEVFDRIVRPGLKVTLIDAACASSLYSTALGMQLLENGQADAVIAGGCFCPGPGNSCLFSQFGGTTSTGCRPFDADADGVVFSEGAALLTLRRLSDAQRLELPIVAILAAAGLSSDGRSSSANVPQSHGQLISLQRCYATYGIDPASITAIEGHGTSTPVGDATELKTLHEFFQPFASRPIPVHSLKGLLGHAGWAAGTASIIAACEYLRTRTFPAQANLTELSAAAKASADTLTVLDRPQPLAQAHPRIAIDGFGFGGANAHIVIESPVIESPVIESPDAASSPTASPDVLPSDLATRTHRARLQDELVFVACEQVQPQLGEGDRRRFDRASVRLPDDVRVLPDLADDMDISQTLATILTRNVIAQLPDFAAELRRDTSVILAMRGKTERGIEATLRVLTSRFSRQLQDLPAALESLRVAHAHCRPSRSYTLQCMMPNVAAGRAALLANLNGPNFVVDAGEHSLDEAINAAELLLRGGEAAGTRLAIVGAIQANSAGDPRQDTDNHGAASGPELAVAFGLTTRQLATEQGWPVLGTLAAYRNTHGEPDADSALAASGLQGATLGAQVDGLLEQLRQPHSSAPLERSQLTPMPAPAPLPVTTAAPHDSRDDPFQMHTPVWVEQPLRPRPEEVNDPLASSLLIVVPADHELMTRLLAAVPTHAHNSLVAVVGENAAAVASAFPRTHCVPVSTVDGESCQLAIERINAERPDAIVAVQAVQHWDILQTLSEVADDNRLCEFVFLLAQANRQRISAGHLRMTNLLIGGWNGAVHPRSGAIAGLLKSIERELPALEACSICTRTTNVAEALNAMALEWRRIDSEKEVVYDGTTRLVRRLQPTLPPTLNSPQVQLDASSVIVASGGARGVTAVMLETLVRDYHCTVISLGRNTLVAGPDNPDNAEIERAFYQEQAQSNPGISLSQLKSQFESLRGRWEANRTIESLNQIGGRVVHMAVDVTDKTQVDSALREIATRYGQVDLLIHGAGVQFSKRLEDRSLSEFRSTYSVKVKGLKNLVGGCQEAFGTIVPVHALTSAYSLFGNDGQHDYGAANETLDRLCGSASQSLAPLRWTSLAWLAWDGIGMTRGSEYRALAKQRNLSGIDRDTGQRLFRDVLSGRTGAAINVPLSEAEHVRYEVDTVPRSTQQGECRMIEVRTPLAEIQCLPFHRVRGIPTLPGAWTVERMVNAALRLHPERKPPQSVTIDNLSFDRFVRSPQSQNVSIRVIAEESEGSIAAWMLMDLVHPTGRILSKDLVCASAEFRFGSQQEDADRTNERPTAPAFERIGKSVTDPYCGDNRAIELSGSFDCLDEIYIHAAGRQAMTRLPVGPQWEGEIPALILDAAWRVGAMHAEPNEQALFVPVKIGRLELPLPHPQQVKRVGQWRISSSHPRVADGQAQWDRTEVFDAAGERQILIENAVAKRLD